MPITELPDEARAKRKLYELRQSEHDRRMAERAVSALTDEQWLRMRRMLANAG